MKKIFLGLILISSLIACKKETKSPSTNVSGTKTDTTNVVDQPTSGYGPNISDTDGNTYKTVYIGKQRWMAENLKTTKYSDGTVIPNVTDANQWTKLTIAAWCNYNNSDSLGIIYGKLYNWYSINPISNGNKNVCPTGWHVPTRDEWQSMIVYLGKEIGSKLKEVGTTKWAIPNTNATNLSLFTGLPGGNRSDGYYNIGINGIWWSSSNKTIEIATGFGLSNNSDDPFFINTFMKSGFSIRCLKD
jgi:uncharacterized protein (TIGR02145 family)